VTRAAVLFPLVLLAGASPFLREHDEVRAGNALLRGGDAAGALGRYAAAEREIGARAELDLDRGDALLALGRHAEAADAFRRAAGRGDAKLASRALQNLAAALVAAGDADGAIRALAGSLACDPENDDARWNLEVLLRGRAATRTPAASAVERSGAREAAERDRAPGRGGARGERERERPADDERPRRPAEPIGRQDAERLLDARRAHERNAPLFGPERRGARRPDAAKGW